MKGSNKIIPNKNIFIYIGILLIGICIGVLSTNIFQDNSTDTSNNMKENTKESPYTLEELYALVEDPIKFRELNDTTENELAYTIFHFYDYFSKSTPIKAASEVEYDEKGHAIKVNDFKYINYYEFMEFMKEPYEIEEYNIKKAEEDGQERPYRTDYGYYVSMLIGIR